MDKDIVLVGQKIKVLKGKKKSYKIKMVMRLWNKLKDLLGKNSTPELALKVVETSWEKASKKKKEELLKASQSFQRSNSSQTKKPHAKKRPTLKTV